MSAIVRPIVLGLMLLAARADAFLILSPDDICAPDEDPCVIDQPLVSSFALPLDFGLRTVRVTGEGSLRGNLDLLCGAFESDIDGVLIDIETPPLASWRGVRIVARRSCSGDETIPCLLDRDCESLGVGGCSHGDGGIRSSGDMVGGPVAVEMVGAGDVTLHGAIQVASLAAEGGGGSVSVRSTGGSVDLASSIEASTLDRVTTGFPDAYAGQVFLQAAGNLRLRRTMRVVGYHGEIDLWAGGDVVLQSSIVGRGRPFNSYEGTPLIVEAGGDIRIEPGPGRRRLRIDLTGGGDLIGYASRAGDASFTSEGAITVARGVHLRANSGRGVDYDDEPYAGSWWFDAGAEIRFDARLRSRGRGILGTAGGVLFSARDSVSIGPRALVDLRTASEPGVLEIYSGRQAEIDIQGELHLEASRASRPLYYEESASGGRVEIQGGDVRVAGTVKNGGHYGNGDCYLDACRFRLAPGASIVNSTPVRWAEVEGIELLVHGSLLAEAGSEIVALPDTPFRVLYADVLDPPRFLGSASPQPQLVALISDSPLCPVCGDGTRESWEACDDGNRESGDGCDVRCELETP